MQSIKSFILLFILTASAFCAKSQCASGSLQLDSIASGKKVVILNISPNDDNYKKRKSYIGETVTLFSKAKKDADCWYEGVAVFNDQLLLFDYFSLGPAEGEDYAPPANAVADVSAPATFDQQAINQFVTDLYIAYTGSFKSIKGAPLGLYTNSSTLLFPGVDSAIVGPGLQYYALVGAYQGLDAAFAAYVQLINTLSAAPVYPSAFSDQKYFILFLNKPERGEDQSIYINEAFLMQGSGEVLGSTFVDESIRYNVSLYKQVLSDVYTLSFSMYEELQ